VRSLSSGSSIECIAEAKINIMAKIKMSAEIIFLDLVILWIFQFLNFEIINLSVYSTHKGE
jgi:hypothetical protein